MMLTRRTFVASAAAMAMSAAAARPFTAEAWGGDFNAAIAALPDGGAIEGGKWWVKGAAKLAGHRKQLIGMEIVFRGKIRIDMREARDCTVAYCHFRSESPPAFAFLPNGGSLAVSNAWMLPAPVPPARISPVSRRLLSGNSVFQWDMPRRDSEVAQLVESATE